MMSGGAPGYGQPDQRGYESQGYDAQEPVFNPNGTMVGGLTAPQRAGAGAGRIRPRRQRRVGASRGSRPSAGRVMLGRVTLGTMAATVVVATTPTRW